MCSKIKVRSAEEQREVRQDSTVVGASPKKYPEMTALAKLTNFDEKKIFFLQNNKRPTFIFLSVHD